MASRKAVRAALKLLALNFAGDVTPERTQLWAAALEDVSDEQLARAVPEVIRTHRGEFIPPVAIVRDAAGANDAPPADTAAVIRRIDRLGAYGPQSGWQAPSVETVGAEMGGEAAEAYAAVGGGSRLLSDNPTTREIAERDFAKELRVAIERARHHGLPALGGGEPLRALKPGDAP